MQDSLAGQLLATFSTKERKLFRYFLLRPERANQGPEFGLFYLALKMTSEDSTKYVPGHN